MSPSTPISEIRFTTAQAKRLGITLPTLKVDASQTSGAALMTAMNVEHMARHTRQSEEAAYSAGARSARQTNQKPSILNRITLEPQEAQRLSGMLGVDDLSNVDAFIDGIESHVAQTTLRDPIKGF